MIKGVKKPLSQDWNWDCGVISVQEIRGFATAVCLPSCRRTTHAIACLFLLHEEVQ